MTSLPIDPMSAPQSTSLTLLKETENIEKSNESVASETVDNASKNCLSNLSNQVNFYIIFRDRVVSRAVANNVAI